MRVNPVRSLNQMTARIGVARPRTILPASTRSAAWLPRYVVISVRAVRVVVPSMNAMVSAVMMPSISAICASVKPAGTSVIHDAATPSPSPKRTLSPTLDRSAT